MTTDPQPEPELTETQKVYNVASSNMFQLAAYGHHRYHPLVEALTDEGKRQQRDYNDRLLAARDELEAALLRLVAEHAETFPGERGPAWLRSLADDPAALSLLAVRPDERDFDTDPAVSPAVAQSAPAETALRDRIAEGLYPTYGQEDRNRSLAIADAVLAVLPAVVPARAGEEPADETLVHVGWWCWRGDNHGHLATMACRSDNVPIHVPAEWETEMRAVIQQLEDGDEEEQPDAPIEPEALPLLFWDEPAGVDHEDGRITAWLSRAVSLAQSVPAGRLILQVDAAGRLRRALTTALNDAYEAQQPNPTTDPQPVQHAPGTVIRCADCRAKGHTVCADDAVSQPKGAGL